MSKLINGRIYDSPFCNVVFDGKDYKAKVLCYNYWDFGLYDLEGVMILNIIFDGVATTETSIILNDSDLEKLGETGYDFILKLVREAQYQRNHFNERNLRDRFKCGF